MVEEDSGYISYKDITELKKELEGVKSKKDVSTKELYSAVQKLSQIMTDMLDVFGAAAEQMKLEDKEYDLDMKKHGIIISKLDKLIEQNKTIAESMVSIADMVKGKLDMDEEEKKEPTFKSDEGEDTLFNTQQEWQPKPMKRVAEPQMMSPKIMPINPPKTEQPITPPMSHRMATPPEMPYGPMPMQRPKMPHTPISMQSMPPQIMPINLPKTEQPITPPIYGPMPMSPPMPSAPEHMPKLEVGMPDFGAPLPSIGPEPLPDLDFTEEPFSLEEEPKKKGLFGMFRK